MSIRKGHYEKIFIFLLLSISICLGCKKRTIPQKSSSKIITSFIFYKVDNPLLKNDIVARISNDTIHIEVAVGTDISQLIPTIIHSGISISPASKIAQNFSTTILYKITAEDGSLGTYKTNSRYLSRSREITSFIFEKAKNVGLSTDIIGMISGDSILVNLPSSASISSLIPSIVHTGASISPPNQQTVSFTSPLQYLVTAEDGSVRNYTVFVSANKFIFIQGEDGYLYCINAMSGSIFWKYFSGGSGNYTFRNGVVFISGKDNTVYALNAADGSLKWASAPPKGSFQLTLPAVRGGKIYFGGSGYLAYPNSNILYTCDFVYALNEKTGAKEWLTTFAVNNGYRYLLNVSVDENVVCAYDRFQGIHVFDANNGTVMWTKPNDDLGSANPIIHNNVIYYAYDLGLTAVEANSGTPIWRFAKCYSSPTIDGNIIYSYGGRTLYAINLQTGSGIWEVSNLNNDYYTPYVNNHSLFVALSNHFLISFDAATGNVNWKKEGFSGEYLVAANNDLYVCDVNNKLSCLDATNGTTKWVATSLPGFTKPFCIVDYQNNLFHVTSSGEKN